jgi:hypothetical protein
MVVAAILLGVLPMGKNTIFGLILVGGAQDWRNSPLFFIAVFLYT